MYAIFTGIKPSVLPSLQHIYGMKFSAETDIGFVHMHEKLPRNSWRSDNSQSLGELLLQFFEYYNNFKYMNRNIYMSFEHKYQERNLGGEGLKSYVIFWILLKKNYRI